MPISSANDPRAFKIRTALQKAFKDLLRNKPYRKISITDIADRAVINRLLDLTGQDFEMMNKRHANFE
ncbi:MAG: hypothetical protein E4H33_00410 [Anaerolineales bacterium]|nr:MAG: hypothetical protein E4H33_00410 [Anaerolineales bacterium]